MDTYRKIKRVVEFGDGSFGVEECNGFGEWSDATWGMRFYSRKDAQAWIDKNTVKRTYQDE